MIGTNGSYNCPWEDISTNSPISTVNIFNQSSELHSNNLELKRLSNTDSGYISLYSQRNSSYSARNSNHSSISTQWNSQNNKHTELIQTRSNMQSVSQKITTTTVYTAGSSGNDRDEVDCSSMDEPPAIPQKTRKKPERQPSPYDNVPDSNLGNN